MAPYRQGWLQVRARANLEAVNNDMAVASEFFTCYNKGGIWARWHHLERWPGGSEVASKSNVVTTRVAVWLHIP